MVNPRVWEPAWFSSYTASSPAASQRPWDLGWEPKWVGRFQLLSFRTLGTHLLPQTQMAKAKPAGGKNSIPESFQWSRPPAQLQGGERVEGLTLSDLSQGQCPGARTPLSHPGPWFLCVLQTCHRHAVPLASSSGGTDLELGSAFRKAQLESQLCHLTAV